MRQALLSFSRNGALERARLIAGAASARAQAASDHSDRAASDSGAELAPLGRFARYLLEAGIDERTASRHAIFCAVVTAVSAAAFAIGMGKLWLAIVVAAPAAFYFHLRARRLARAEAFESDYPALLITLSSAIRTGLDPIAALIGAEALFRPGCEVARAIANFKRSIDQGSNEESAIRNFAKDIPHPDIALFRSAFLMARRHGSSVGDCLHRLARVTRGRQSFRRKVRAALAMQKLSALGIAGSAIAIALIQQLSNPKSLKAAMAHPVGFKLIICGMGLIVLGLSWMLLMARRRL